MKVAAAPLAFYSRRLYQAARTTLLMHTPTPSHTVALPSSLHASSDPLMAARRQFPVLEQLTYLSICEKSIVPDCTRAAVDLYLDRMQSAAANRTEHEIYVETARQKFARLINAQQDEIAFTRNVSDGINSIACSIDWRPGDNVVLTTELEHPNNLYPWRHLERLGVEIRAIPPCNGAIDATAMIAAIDTRTRVVTAATVTFAPGLRTDLAAIGKVTRERGVLFVVDAVQSAGILRLDAERDLFDCLATSTSKGLLGLYGAGFLYCRLAVADQLQPAYLSRTGIDAGPGQHSEGGNEAYRLAPGARRFEVGSFPLAEAYAADASLDLILGIGIDAIEAHALRLAKLFADELRERKLPVCPAPTPALASHIVTVGGLGSGGHDFSRDEQINELASWLRDNRVSFTIRRGQLRFAFHLYNNVSDIERVMALIDAHLRR